MKVLATHRLVGRLVVLFASTPMLGQTIPLENWTVPPYRAAGASGGLSTMTDISPGVGFVAMQPCRIVDTRGGGVFTGAYGPPALVANATRSFDLDSAPHCTGIPSGVEAYSLNFTVVNTTGGPGDLRAWPTGNPPVQTTSVLNWTSANVIIANATIIGAGTNGSIDVTAAGFGTHVLIDINGYLTDEYQGGTQFVAVSILGGGGAILGVNPSSVPGSHGVGGFAGGANAVHGVQGQAGSSALGGSSGVHGINNSTATGVAGVLGEVSSQEFGAYGVLGRDGSGIPGGAADSVTQSGVRGESKLHWGVTGISESTAVGGLLYLPAGSPLAAGYLGTISGGFPYGVYSVGNAFVDGNLTVDGNISAAMKPFIQPHPFDPSKEIRYVSLEGPYSEVYFRGTAQISQGATRIPIPEHFRLVSTSGSYSTLVTPVGGMATVAVLSEDADGIVIQASHDVKIHYVVYAERDAMRNPDPIIENVDFRPEPGGERLAHLPDSYRQLMIQNGTLNADGTVNLETARRLGWDKNWRSDSGRLTSRPD
jgi:hypothetical protein